MDTFTVFAVYEDDLQPYAQDVQADDPGQAVELAQQMVDRANGGHVSLVGLQVARGKVEVVS